MSVDAGRGGNRVRALVVRADGVSGGTAPARAYTRGEPVVETALPWLYGSLQQMQLTLGLRPRHLAGHYARPSDWPNPSKQSTRSLPRPISIGVIWLIKIWSMQQARPVSTRRSAHHETIPTKRRMLRQRWQNMRSPIGTPSKLTFTTTAVFVGEDAELLSRLIVSQPS